MTQVRGLIAGRRSGLFDLHGSGMRPHWPVVSAGARQQKASWSGA